MPEFTAEQLKQLEDVNLDDSFIDVVKLVESLEQHHRNFFNHNVPNLVDRGRAYETLIENYAWKVVDAMKEANNKEEIQGTLNEWQRLQKTIEDLNVEIKATTVGSSKFRLYNENLKVLRNRLDRLKMKMDSISSDLTYVIDQFDSLGQKLKSVRDAAQELAKRGAVSPFRDIVEGPSFVLSKLLVSLLSLVIALVVDQWTPVLESILTFYNKNEKLSHAIIFAIVFFTSSIILEPLIEYIKEKRARKNFIDGIKYLRKNFDEFVTLNTQLNEKISEYNKLIDIPLSLVQLN